MNIEELETPLNGAIKIGKKDHINALQKDGYLYCNTIKYFRVIEQEDFNRHDAREGAYKTEIVESPEDYKLYFKGEKALFITDLFEFTKRVKSRLHELEIDYKWGHVDYYKESGVNENITAFHKPDIFEHQNEFRILIKENSTTPLSFEIGSIEDISIMFDTNDLKKITLQKQ